MPKAQLAEALTRTPCLGDTFAHDYAQVRAKYGHVSYMKSGMPCTDWSLSGPKTGRSTAVRTGWMYNAQITCILDLEPDTLCLEQVAHILHVDKSAVTELITKLEEKYAVYSGILNIWMYGDPCNRERLIIVGIHRKFGALANTYTIPHGRYHSGRAPQAWMLPARTRTSRHACGITIKFTTLRGASRCQAGSILLGLLAEVAWDFQTFLMPSIPQWQSLYNCQTSHNGGGRRPPLDWKPGEEITRTRLTTIKETTKIACLPSDYEPFARGIRDDDDFLRELVNPGWPLRFAHAIDSSITEFLERAYGTTRHGIQRPRDIDHTTLFSGSVSLDISVKSILVDSGAQISCP